MSEFQISRASSLSIFSDIGTSIVSGGSETGGHPLVIDDLSDAQLARVVEDLRASVRRLSLETKMFEDYFGRLVTGSSRGGDRSQSGSRKGSTASQLSGSETDSRPTTAGGDMSTMGSRRRRSGSKAGSLMGKSLKISTDQKIKIAKKEIKLVESSLSNFRSSVLKSKRDGLAEIEERALTLRESVKCRERLAKNLEVGVCFQEGKKRFNADIVDRVLSTEVKLLRRAKEKLQTKNGVLLSQQVKITAQIKQLLAKKEVTGPVDLDQIHLENVEMLGTIRDKNGEITSRRKAISTARHRKKTLQEVLRQEDKRTVELVKMNEDKDKTLNRSEKSVNGLSHRVSRQRVKNNELKKLTENYHAPTIDGYFDIKVSQHEGLKKQQERERKKELEKLIKKNQKAREKRNRRVAKKPAKKIRIPSPSSKDQIYRGPTFDIVYTVPA